MPAHGDQHKPNGATTTNPFEEQKPHISEYTAQEIATLQSRLNKRLGPEFLSTRPGPGNQKIPYLSAEKAINLANEVFGFNGWSTSVQNIQIDFVDESPQTGKVSIGLSVVVRVTLKDGTYHEDIGYGGIENCKGKATAFEKSKKEATTDALKRALRNFGNVLGNCVYDREYVTKVSKIKAGIGRFDVNELHRHPDFVPKTTEGERQVVPGESKVSNPASLGYEESFDTSEFDDIDFNDNDLGHSEEILLPADANLTDASTVSRSSTIAINTPSRAPNSRHIGPPPLNQSRTVQQNTKNYNAAPDPVDVSGLTHARNNTWNRSMADQNDHRNDAQPISLEPDPPLGVVSGPQLAGFWSAKATKNVDVSNISSLPPQAVQFNPHAESPSIRKTAGVDHSKSVPVRREVQKVDSPVNGSTSSHSVDSRNDVQRRPGVLGGPSAPLGQSPNGFIARPGMSTNAYRPPTRHNGISAQQVGPVHAPGISNNFAGPAKPPDRATTALKRPPLNDVSNMQHATGISPVIGDSTEVKRPRTGPGLVGEGGPVAINPDANVGAAK